MNVYLIDLVVIGILIVACISFVWHLVVRVDEILFGRKK